MIIIEIFNEIDYDQIYMCQLCDTKSGMDSSLLWYPYFEWNPDYDYYFIRSEIQCAKTYVYF